MKHHVLSHELASSGGRLFQNETELLNIHCRTSLTENSSNSQFVVTNLHLFYLTWLIFCSSVCHQSWKTEKLPSTICTRIFSCCTTKGQSLRIYESKKRESEDLVTLILLLLFLIHSFSSSSCRFSSTSMLECLSRVQLHLLPIYLTS